MNLPYYTKLTTAFAIPAGIPQRTTGALVNLPYYTRLSTAFAIPAGTPRRTAGALVNFPYYTTLTAAPRRATGEQVIGELTLLHKTYCGFCNCFWSVVKII